MRRLLLTLLFAVFQLYLVSASALSLPDGIFKLESLNGVSWSEKDRDKKVGFVVVFLSSSCPCSISHMGHIAELAEKYPEFQFVGLHADVYVSQSDAKEYFQSNNSFFPVLSDRHFKISRGLNALTTPHAFVFASTGEVSYQGAVTSSAMFSSDNKLHLKESLKAIKNGKAVSTAKTRPLGCALNYGRPN